MAELEKIQKILKFMIEEINTLIKEKEITKTFLSRKLGVSRPTLEKVLVGNSDVETIGKLLEICRNYVVN